MKNWLRRRFTARCREPGCLGESLIHAASLYGIAFDRRECERLCQPRSAEREPH
ncbi:hypothetical protein [Pantoea sp. 1.19]|uniref:hypothetical protein n=1 Tax=Pantoea sp. 1.19 TaxID=1925589 RepID=UPI0014802F27|nr:hypothetical protein [Pantoea sp. 1.19]